MIPTTVSDNFLLALESLMRRTGQGPHLSATVIELDRAPDPTALNRAAEAISQRHPLLNAHLKRPLPWAHTQWQPNPPAPVPVHFHTDLSIHDLLGEIFANHSIDIFRPGPNLEWHITRTPDDRHALALLWPHALFDAIGIDRLITELDDPTNAPTEAWGETARFPGPLRERWKLAKPMALEMRGFPTWRVRSAHRRNTPAGAPRFEIIQFNDEDSAAIRQHMARVAGELLLIPYFAAISARAVQRALKTRHPNASIPALVSLPVQRVNRPDKRPLFQNQMGAWSLMLRPDDLDAPLADTVKALHRAYVSFMRRKLAPSMDALMSFLQRCPSRLALIPASLPLRGEICTLFHSHTGPLPATDPTRFFGCQITDAYHMPTVSSPPGVGIFFSESHGRLRATLSWREGTHDAAEIHALKSSLFDDLGLPANHSQRPPNKSA